MHLTSGLLRLCPVALVALLIAPPAPAQEAPADGIFVTVNNPITEGVISQVKGQVDAARNNPRRNVKTVVFNFNPEGRDAATEFFGTSYELAKYVRTLRANGMRTVAWVHGKTTRHTVLPVIACDELVMSSDAKIGDVVGPKEPSLSKNEQDAYLEMAGSVLKAGPVMKMFDKDVKLVQASQKGRRCTSTSAGWNPRTRPTPTSGRPT